MRTSFHHQPEAQHPKSPAIYTPAGRLPHLWVISGQTVASPRSFVVRFGPRADKLLRCSDCPLSADFVAEVIWRFWRTVIPSSDDIISLETGDDGTSEQRSGSSVL